MSCFPSRTTTAAAAALIACVLPVARAEAQRASQGTALLTSATDLKKRLGDANTVILHVGDPKKYAEGHIPGARNANPRDLSNMDTASTGGLLLQMLDARQLQAKLEALGISDGSRVVIYTAQQYFSPATRLLATFDYAGLGDRATMLDGGLESWAKAGNPVEQGDEKPLAAPGKLAPLKLKSALVVDGNFVESHIGTRGFSIIDARDTTFYQGIAVGGGPVRPHLKGHIASAKNVPFSSVWTDSSYAKSMEELKQIFAKAGVAPGDTVVAYCHIGQQATSAIFGARLLGYPVLLYDGSFEDWSRRPNARVEATPRP